MHHRRSPTREAFGLELQGEKRRRAAGCTPASHTAKSAARKARCARVPHSGAQKPKGHTKNENEKKTKAPECGEKLSLRRNSQLQTAKGGAQAVFRRLREPAARCIKRKGWPIGGT